MPPITFDSTDDELDSAPSPDEREEESLEGEHSCAREGHRADVLREGELQDAKRLRVHSPPPTAAASADAAAAAAPSEWKWRPQVGMGDAATAFDVAAMNVFAYGDGLTERSPEGERPVHVWCVRWQRQS